MTNQKQPNIDATLYDHLLELSEMAKEVGAELSLAIRKSTNIQIQFEKKFESSPPNKITIIPTYHIEPTHTVLIIKFPASDDQEDLIEIL